MHRHLMVIKVKPESRKDYVAAHQNPWPEMLDAIHKSGFKNELIWYYENQSIIYFECEDDYHDCNARLRKFEICKKWDIEMVPRFAAEPAMPEKIFDLQQQRTGQLTQD